MCIYQESADLFYSRINKMFESWSYHPGGRYSLNGISVTFIRYLDFYKLNCMVYFNGQRVIYTGKENFGKGVILDIEREPYGVKFDLPNHAFHSINGKCEWGYGWYCFETELKLDAISILQKIKEKIDET